MFAHVGNNDRASRQTASEGHSNDFTSNVTEQFKFMHVSANKDQQQRHIQELANTFMSTLGINEKHPEYFQKLEKMTRELNGMMIQPQQQQPPPATSQQGPTNNAATSSANGAVPPSKDSDKNEARPGQIPGRRYVSPRRRQTVRSKSPLATKTQSNADNNNNMSVDNEFDEFFEAHSTMDSFTFDSPNPKRGPKPSSAQKQQPSPNGRPPLATVHLSGMKNSPMPSPQPQASKFKFDKDKDKFHMGTSPPKKPRSPGKKSKSPSHRSSPISASSNNPTNSTPLQGSPLTEGGTPWMTSVKKPQHRMKAASAPFASPRSDIPTTKPKPNMASAGAPFFSPVPDVFHAPETFVHGSGSRGIPTPQNILQTNATSHRQSAPAAMSAAAAAAAASFHRPSTAPKTPFDSMATGVPATAPDTDETLIKKKTRNTATPNLGVATASIPKFKVDLSQNTNANAKGKRGNTLRKGFNNGNASTKPNGRSSFVFGSDNNAKVESPTNSSPVAMDTSPIFSPPLQNNQRRPQTGGFSVGVGGDKGRSRRKEVQRRGQVRKHEPANINGPSQSSFDLNHVQVLHEKKLASIRADILGMKEMGKTCYIDGRYQQATQLYSEAIERFKFELFAHIPAKDLLATLLWNRAAALLMIGAFESAAEDCRNGILYVTDPRNTSMGVASPDMNATLRPKIYIRMGRSFLKLGKIDDADRAFSEAIASATAIQDFHLRQNIPGAHNDLENVKTNAMMVQTEVGALRARFIKIHTLGEFSTRETQMECLVIVKEALNTASGCHELHLKKVELLAKLHRWREISSHCERFAASNVLYDGCLIGDLSAKNPFPGVPVAKYLRADYFKDASEEYIKGVEKVLDKKSAAEAILRLPNAMMPYYLRSLRLNEKYFVEEECILILDQYIKERMETTGEREYVLGQFLWLAEERAKMEQTKIERGIADDRFGNNQFRVAAMKYADCLTIDSGAKQQYTGCRLHAVLHSNRAACFMMDHKYRDAITECTAALRIYPRYLKPLLRRARCYSRLERVPEAVNDFKHWLDIVKQSRDGKYNPVLTDLVFDGPQTIKPIDVENVKAELNGVLEAKAKAEADERTRQARNTYQEYSRKHRSERSSQYNGKASPSHEETHRRREHFYKSSQNNSQRWDSFKDRSSHSNRQEKPKAQKSGYKSKSSPGGHKSQGSPKESDDHYTVLGIDRRATEDQIKKAYKKMALKYHPDKNKDNPSAADNFLRIKDAYETLKDPHARRKYDSQSRRRRY